MIRFSDQADSPEKEWFWLPAGRSSRANLKEGCAYRLTLSLEADYQKNLAVRDNNPQYYENLFSVQIVAID
jgi:hypothetical protein